jgi:hypothetical protein
MISNQNSAKTQVISPERTIFEIDHPITNFINIHILLSTTLRRCSGILIFWIQKFHVALLYRHYFHVPLSSKELFSLSIKYGRQALSFSSVISRDSRADSTTADPGRFITTVGAFDTCTGRSHTDTFGRKRKKNP